MRTDHFWTRVSKAPYPRGKNLENFWSQALSRSMNENLCPVCPKKPVTSPLTVGFKINFKIFIYHHKILRLKGMDIFPMLKLLNIRSKSSRI